jgi:hypothetical protein
LEVGWKGNTFEGKKHRSRTLRSSPLSVVCDCSSSFSSAATTREIQRYPFKTESEPHQTVVLDHGHHAAAIVMTCCCATSWEAVESAFWLEGGGRKRAVACCSRALHNPRSFMELLHRRSCVRCRWTRSCGPVVIWSQARQLGPLQVWQATRLLELVALGRSSGTTKCHREQG